MDIVRLTKEDGKSLMELYRSVTEHLQKSGVRQWDRFYPNRFVIGGDVKRGTAYGIRDGGRHGEAAVSGRGVEPGEVPC